MIIGRMNWEIDILDSRLQDSGPKDLKYENRNKFRQLLNDLRLSLSL